MKQKLKYLLRSAFNLTQPKQCPYCGSTHFKTVDSKFLVTSLLLCEDCRLMHRHPKDDVQRLQKFYQKEYSIDNQFMTRLPSDEQIQKLKENSFPTCRNYDTYLKAMFDGNVKLIDYGCSWGYNVFQLREAGHDAVGYELSVPRAEFGERKLGVKIHTDPNQLPSENDVMLSSHVIEHLSDIQEFISLSKKVLKKDGLFMAFCPNGSEVYRQREPHEWHVNWGALHPNYLHPEFAMHAFRKNPFLILTADWQFSPLEIVTWDGESQFVGEIGKGKELLIIAKPNVTIPNPKVHTQPSAEKMMGIFQRILESIPPQMYPEIA